MQAEFGGSGDDVSERVDPVASTVGWNGTSTSFLTLSERQKLKTSRPTHPYSGNSSSMSTSAVQTTLSFSSRTQARYLATPASILRKSGLVVAIRGGGRGAGGGEPMRVSEGLRCGACGCGGLVEAKREAASVSSADMGVVGGKGRRSKLRQAWTCSSPCGGAEVNCNVHLSTIVCLKSAPATRNGEQAMFGRGYDENASSPHRLLPRASCKEKHALAYVVAESTAYLESPKLS